MKYLKPFKLLYETKINFNDIDWEEEDPNMSIEDKDLVEFLNDVDHNKFIENCINDKHNNINDIDELNKKIKDTEKSEYFELFTWAETPEKFDYWDKLDINWRRDDDYYGDDYGDDYNYWEGDDDY